MSNENNVVLPEPMAVIKHGKLQWHIPCDTYHVPIALSSGEHKLYTEQQLRALLATATGLPAQEVDAVDPVQAAADAASVGHLSHLIDHQSQILARAMAAMKAVESTAAPIDESHGDLDARIPYEAWATFVDARAALLHDVAQSPVAAPQAQADARDAVISDLSAALDMFVGTDALHSLCEQEPMDAMGRVKGTWSKAADVNARATIKTHSAAIAAAKGE